MSNKTTIRVLDNLKLYHDDDNECWEALTRAIKALEAYDKILPLLDTDIDAELALEKIREVIYD